jgi:hypothetical protein
MAVINAKTGQLEELEPQALAEGLASGTYLPPADQGVLLNSSGNLVFLPGQDVSQAVNEYGYKIPSPDELRQIGRDVAYGTDTAQLQAGLAGAARGGTFGISDFLAVKTGLTSPEHLSALKEYYPGTSIAGEIGGALLGAALPAPISPVAALVKGTKAAEAAAVGRAAAALPASKAADVIAKAAIETGGKALGGAIEGMAFGLGQSVSEAALGDPDLTAEKVMANISYGGLLGGSLGAGLNVGKIGLKKALEKGKAAYASAYEKLIGKVAPIAEGELPKAPPLVTGEGAEALVNDLAAGPSPAEINQEVFQPGALVKSAAKISSKFTGTPEQEILDNIAAANDPNRIILTTAEKNAKAALFRKQMQDIYDTTTSLSQRASSKIRPIETAELLDGVDPTGPLSQLDQFKQNLDAGIAKLRGEPELYNQGMARKLEKFSERIAKDESIAFKNSAELFEELNLLKRNIDEMQKFEKGYIANTSERNAIKEVISPLMGDLRRGLEDSAVWGEAGARQSAYNERLTAFLRAKDGIEQQLMTSIKGKGPRPIKKFATKKINTFFNQINDDRAEFQNDAVAEFLKAGRELIDEVEKTSLNAPGQKLDVTGLRDFVSKASDEALNAKQYVADSFGGFGFFRDLMDAARSGGLSGMASQIGTAFADPNNIVRTLSWIEKAAMNTSKAVEKTSKFIFEKAKPPTKGAGIIIEKETTGQRTERYKKAIEKLKNLSDVPDAMLNDLDNATRETFEYAPKISQGLQLAAVRATGFLLSKMPQSPDKGILDEPYQPSQAQIITFMRYNDVVDNPLVALKQLEDNYVPRETLETLKTVYPSLYADMKQSIIGQLTDKMAGGKVDLPYQKRVVLSQFLEMPLDSSFRPDIMAKNQQSLAVISQKAEAKEAAERAVRPSQTGLGKVSLSSRNQTGLEKVASRA